MSTQRQPQQQESLKKKVDFMPSFSIVLHKNESSDAPPLDFSFKDIHDLEQIKQIVPRSGKRKEIKIEVQEVKEDEKKEAKPAEEESKKNTEREKTNAQEDENQAENEEGEKEDEKEKEEKEKKDQKKEKDVKKSPEVLIPTQNIAQNLVAQHSISLTSGQGKVIGGKLQENKNNMMKQSVKINLVCCSLILCQNQIRSIANFYQVMDQVMFDVGKLQWIDLSHNYIEKLDNVRNLFIQFYEDFREFPFLQSLYLHCNYIKDIEDISQVSQLTYSILFLSFHIYNTQNQSQFMEIQLNKYLNLDFILLGAYKYQKELIQFQLAGKQDISYLIILKERDNANVWITKFKIKAKPIANPPKPPEKKTQQQNQNEQNKVGL